MPTKANFVVTKKEGKGEPISRGMGQLVKDLKDAPGGQVISGSIGKVEDELLPEAPPETPDEESQRKALKYFIQSNVAHHTLGGKFTAKQEKNLFIKKMQKQTLESLKRIWDKPIPEEITDEVLSELQSNFDDVSP